MLLALFRNGFEDFDAGSLLTFLAGAAVVFFLCMPVHECAHAWAAKKMGDHTARLAGRLTLNPMAHLDPFGCLLILLVGFGYAKPVPVNIRNFKKRKLGMALTALAGPLSNLLMALLFLSIYMPIAFFHETADPDLLTLTRDACGVVASINISMAVFNLLPIPPLDGSRVVGLLIPDRLYYQIMNYERYIRYGLFALLAVGILDWPVSFLSAGVSRGLWWLAALPYVLLSKIF
ncbi:MAG: site-2 protease family protein [Oscillospiraceae bacterium]|jgi:Zn-dependent protease|nr:site-2 protease family protein [Oscillospiraceae bacterium]